MSTTWVWRPDGTLQCGLGREETLDEARAQLATVIGDEEIIRGEKRTLPSPHITLCGAPTGEVNAFELTPFGFWLLFHGFVGPIGFRPWVDDPQSVAASSASGPFGDPDLVAAIERIGLPQVGGPAPVRIDELFGRVCRAYKVGDALTKDFLPDRVNIGLEGGRIKEIWFG